MMMGRVGSAFPVVGGEMCRSEGVKLGAGMDARGRFVKQKFKESRSKFQ
jgi:hypothetical protein